MGDLPVVVSDTSNLDTVVYRLSSDSAVSADELPSEVSDSPVSPLSPLLLMLLLADMPPAVVKIGGAGVVPSSELGSSVVVVVVDDVIGAV